VNHGKEKEESFSPAHGHAEPERAGDHEPAGCRYLDNTSGKGEGMIVLTNPTMAGTKDPRRKIEKLSDRISHLREEIAIREDQIQIMNGEIWLIVQELNHEV
jgi:hypothetical protein